MAVPRVLTIAGSDSGGGAGIQADLKAIARAGGHGMTAITALTAQNTVGVTGVHPVPPAFIVQQVRTVVEDIGVDAVKTGMLGDAATIDAVVEALGLVGDVPVVVDPVMVAESGAVLLAEEARSALVERLLPLATVVTPNVPEARALLGEATPGRTAPTGEAAAGAARAEEGPRRGGPSGESTDIEDLARRIRALGPRVVVVTGGHRELAVDTFFDGERVEVIPGARHGDGAAHGSGCTHASALATSLAHGLTPLDAARRAREIAGEAIRNGLSELGAGAGPVDALNVRERVPRVP